MTNKKLKVEEDCNWVAENASNVKINHDKIGEYAEFIINKYHDETMPELISEEYHYRNPDNQEDVINYIFELDSINFASGYFRLAKSLYNIDINYYAIADMLKHAFEAGDINTPTKWQNISPSDFFKYLNLEENKYPKIDEIVYSCIEAHKDTGDLLVNNYSGSTVNFIEDCNFSATEIAFRLSQLPKFNDIFHYKERNIAILKRAQILPADIDLIYRPYLNDIENLTIFADNVVPHTLCYDDVLIYSDELKDKIDRKIPIQNGCDDEIELRACSIHAVELMKQYLHEQSNTNIRSVDLDRLLWHRGQDEIEFTSKTTHVTESYFY